MTRWRTWGAAGLVLLVAAVYGPALHGPFIFDDDTALVNNPTLRSFRAALRPPDDSPVSARPLTNLTFAVNYRLHGLEPWGYRLVSYALHAANALLLWALLTLILRNTTAVATGRGVVAWFVAAVWAVHPLHTEAVVYITQRTELLASFFMLATLLLAHRSMRSVKAFRWQLAAALACALGMASKEIAAVTPLLVLLYDRVFAAGSFTQALRARAGLYALLALSWLVLVWALLTSTRSESVGLGFGIGALDYFRTQAQVIAWYLRLCFWPWPLRIVYSWPIVHHWFDAWPYVLSLTALGVGTVVAVWRGWAVGFAGAVFFLILAPTSSFLPIVSELAAERRMYLPSAAVLSLAIVALAAVARRRGVAWLTTGVAAVVLALLAGVSLHRLDDYRSHEAIWQSAVRVAPDDSLAWTGLGAVWLNQGHLQRAQEAFERAVALRPDNANAHHVLGVTLEVQGRLDEAIRSMSIAAHQQPANAVYRRLLANMLAKAQLWPQAREQITAALELDPARVDLWLLLAFVRAQLGEVDGSAAAYGRVLVLQPDNVAALAGLALILAEDPELSDPARAVELARRACELTAGENVKALATLGKAAAAAGLHDEARDAYRRALAVAQRDAPALIPFLTDQLEKIGGDDAPSPPAAPPTP